MPTVTWPARELGYRPAYGVVALDLAGDVTHGEVIGWTRKRERDGQCEWITIGSDEWHRSRGGERTAHARVVRKVGKKVGWALWCAVTGCWQAGVETLHSATRTEGETMTAVEHFTRARELSVDHGHAVRLARFFCPDDSSHGSTMPCDRCTNMAIDALVWLGGDKPSALVSARKQANSRDFDSGTLSAYALLALAESAHEANIEARARDMIAAHVTVFDEWADSELERIARNAWSAWVSRPEGVDRGVDEIVREFRQAMMHAIPDPQT